MEVELSTVTVEVDATTEVLVKLFGTEQGIQVRAVVVDTEKATGYEDPIDTYSISYPEVLELSFDIEKGKPNPPYGIPGSGFETDHWHWKRPG